MTKSLKMWQNEKSWVWFYWYQLGNDQEFLFFLSFLIIFGFVMI